ncbi:MAG: HEPN domain-containing protein [Deltaproteobacteria bacterium]|nr:HEPN domain-containing protein [Deltaproteobacteria bacterium]
MPPKVRNPNDPQEWLRRARSNLARARLKADPDIVLEDLCADAQQAAEKAIKAVFVHLKIRFPRTHDILELLTLLRSHSVDIPEELLAGDELTGYALDTRYPGWIEDTTDEEHERALCLAERSLAWATAVINKSK